MYILIPKEKRNKLDPSRRKGIFVGYNDTSKSYRIYFLGFKKIDINRDVTFDEDLSYIKSINKPTEEAEAPRIHDTIMNEETQEEYREFEEPQRPVDPPQEKNPHKRKPLGYEILSKVQKDMGF